MIAVKLNAPNDPNGNPQRGWLILDETDREYDARVVAFVDEGYGQVERTVREAFPGVIFGPAVKIPRAEYHRWRRFDPEA